MQNIIIPFVPLIVAVTFTIVLGLLLMPRNGSMQLNDVHRGDGIPSRILIGTAFIIY